MRQINRTLLLLAGIAANLVLACGGAQDKQGTLRSYPNDSTRLDYRRDNDMPASVERQDSLVLPPQ